METQIKERQAGYYKIINAEKQYQDGVATGMYWITDASRVLVSEEEYLEEYHFVILYGLLVLDQQLTNCFVNT